MNAAIKQTPFFHVALEGSAYEVGRMQGELIRTIPGWLGFVRSGKGKLTPEAIKETSALFDRYCPGINEEIRGTADGAGIPFDEVMYYTYTYLRTGHCSHLVALPSVTVDGHIFVGRNYEFGDSMDDFRLCTTRILGKYAHIGFSTVLFGRNDGMNEHGLSVTTSSGGLPVGPVLPPIQDGFQFWALVRTILEGCRSVDEGLAVVEAFPCCGNSTLILADRNGNAALVEFYGPHKAVRRINDSSSDPILFATNHYSLPEMCANQSRRMANSVVRYQAIETFLKREAPQVSREKVKSLLAAGYPDGLACPYYSEFFGTLHSIVFDLTSGDLEVCFGSPQFNPWYRMDLTTPASPAPYVAVLPEEKAEAEFWKMV